MTAYLVFLLLFPVLWGLLARKWLVDTICWKETALAIVMVTAVVAGVWYIGKYTDMQDTEIWNGEITGKSRIHGSYVVTYSCRCNSKGACSTCTQTHYTVDWDAQSTAGNIDIDHADSTLPLVYMLPDPPAYKSCEKGQPASVEHSYVNYVKAVPDSLFHLNPLLSVYDKSVPKYPRVHDFYKINRVINVGTNVDTATLNDLLNERLKAMGPKKQVNVVVIVTNILEQSFKFAVENKWLAGKKNDVIVYLGLDGDKIAWSDATIWVKNTGNEYLSVLMRDGLMDLGTYDPKKVGDTISGIIEESYKRPKMEQFSYLLDEIDPPLWAVILATLLSIGGSIALTYYFNKNEVFS